MNLNIKQEKNRLVELVDQTITQVKSNMASKKEIDEYTKVIQSFLDNLELNETSEQAVIELIAEEDGFTKRMQVLNMVLSYIKINEKLT